MLVRLLLRLCLAVALFVALDVVVFSYIRILDAADEADLPRSDAIAVFSGDPARVVRGFELLENEKAPRLFIAGVDNGPEIAAEEKKRPALAKCCVTVETKSQTTQEDAAAIARWAQREGVQSLIVVTTNIHMPRAIAELERQLPHATLATAGISNGIDKSRDWRNNPRIWPRLKMELLKYVAVRLEALIRWRSAPAAES